MGKGKNEIGTSKTDRRCSNNNFTCRQRDNGVVHFVITLPVCFVTCFQAKQRTNCILSLVQTLFLI